jgi:hypothetical protein
MQIEWWVRNKTTMLLDVDVDDVEFVRMHLAPR